MNNKRLSSTGLSTPGSIERFETMVMNNSPLYEGRISSAPACLVCLVGPREMVGRYWTVDGEKKLMIGRSRKCDIPIQDLSISKKHLLVRRNKETKVFIEDRKSTNGTFINDKQITANKEWELSDNDRIKTGNIVFKFLDEGNPEIFSIMENFEKVFRDALTGAGNRLLMERRAKEMFIKSKQYNTPLSFVIFDIDHFKKVNDTYGHPAGDFVLKQVSGIAKSCFRCSDTFTRSGGEEFCVILQSEPGRAKEAIENARAKIELKVFTHRDQNIKVTVSAGVSCRLPDDKNWKEIYERADQLLYKAKTAGRNKVFASELMGISA